jgi:transposase
MSQDIILTVDYHDRMCVIRRRDLATNREQVFAEVPTARENLNQIVDQARRDAGRRGRVIWIQESTTGWARVQQLLGQRVDFRLANVLQMPRTAKAHKRKTDKVDTARIQREYLNGELPLAFQPSPECRQLRRIVAYREGLVNRRTALRNWINRYLAHETWYDTAGLWSVKGQLRLRSFLKTLPRTDALIIHQKLEELARLEEQLKLAVDELLLAYQSSPEARRVDAIKGIGIVSAVSIVARIGPVGRFRSAEELIGFAGLSPGVAQSDQTRRDGHIGGGGTDTHLRHYLIEATVWARELPRYKTAYQRIAKRRGSKIGRLVVARMLLRSIYKILKEGVEFDAGTTCRAKSTAG